jgi:ATP-dependent DNA ligase
MLAKRTAEIPHADTWIFEPKWDGFRTLIFRDGGEILIQSRDTKPLNRYFPELLPALASGLPERCVLDGEIVLAANGRLEFDALQQRIHPATSRVNMLAEQTPASIVFFDLLCEGDRDLTGEPFGFRRERLEALLTAARPPLHLTPATRDRAVAVDWFKRFEGAGLDGVIAKAADGTYEPNKRVMLKVKHERDCDCVVAGFRWYKKGERTAVGSLLLGLYNEAGVLQHVGVCSSFTQEKREELVSLLEPYRENAAVGHPWAGHGAGAGQAPEAVEDGGGHGEQRMPGGQSRWSQGKDLSWVPLRPELVAEVAYEHMQGDRFRHLAHFRRWRLDKPPAECTYAQLEVVPPHELKLIFPADR